MHLPRIESQTILISEDFLLLHQDLRLFSIEPINI